MTARDARLDDFAGVTGAERGRFSSEFASAPVPSTPAGPAVVDLRALKVHAAKSYPVDHPFRLAVLQEPDFLPAGTGAAKLEAYLRLLLALGR